MPVNKTLLTYDMNLVIKEELSDFSHFPVIDTFGFESHKNIYNNCYQS